MSVPKPLKEAIGQGLSRRVQGHEDGSDGVEGDEQAHQFFQLQRVAFWR